MALEISSGSGPELPMQVVQPNATRLKPIASRSFCRPDFARYSAPTWQPGASEGFTHGLGLSPRAAALRASRPAAIMTLGLDVLVHDVMAAITTSPWPRSCLRAATGTRLAVAGLPSWASADLPNSFSSADAKLALASLSSTRSCGRFGPASDDSMLPSSSLSTSVNTGSGVLLVRNKPCALA